MAKDFIFVGDVIDFTDSDSYDLGFKHTLRRANREEIEYISQIVKPYLIQTELTRGTHYFNVYELYKKEKENGCSYPKFRSIDDYRYSVIDVPKWTERNHYYSTEWVMNICDFGFTKLFEFNNWGELPPVFSYSLPSPILAHNLFNDNDIYKIDKIKVKEMNESIALDIKSLHSNMVNFLKVVDKYPMISRAIHNFGKHKEISIRSPFKIISLISCLELLLVDGSRDRLKAIKQQLQRKINLLNNRSQNPIDITKYFKGSDTNTIETIITVIYNCRNEIAHGTFTQIQDTHDVLKNIDYSSFIDFVTLLTKRMLQQAIIEPDLIVDLKKC